MGVSILGVHKCSLLSYILHFFSPESRIKVPELLYTDCVSIARVEGPLHP